MRTIDLALRTFTKQAVFGNLLPKQRWRTIRRLVENMHYFEDFDDVPDELIKNKINWKRFVDKHTDNQVGGLYVSTGSGRGLKHGKPYIFNFAGSPITRRHELIHLAQSRIPFFLKKPGEIAEDFLASINPLFSERGAWMLQEGNNVQRAALRAFDTDSETLKYYKKHYGLGPGSITMYRALSRMLPPPKDVPGWQTRTQAAVDRSLKRLSISLDDAVTQVPPSDYNKNLWLKLLGYVGVPATTVTAASQHDGLRDWTVNTRRDLARKHTPYTDLLLPSIPDFINAY